MAEPSQETQERGSVTAKLNYLVRTAESPVNYPSQGGSDLSRFDGSFEDRSVRIQNARGLPFKTDREGFQLVQHASAVTDFYDDSQLKNTYNAEIEQLVMDVTGARRAFAFDHTRRAESRETREQKGVREPAQNVHNDHTERSAAWRLRDELPAEAGGLLERRFAIINIWRPIREPVQSAPLALCDTASVAPEDLVPTERRSRDRVGEIQLVTFNPAHHWYYFPDMRRNEVLLIKVHDSAPDGGARFAIHSAFDDPASPPGAAPRESIETRTFAFF